MSTPKSSIFKEAAERLQEAFNEMVINELEGNSHLNDVFPRVICEKTTKVSPMIVLPEMSNK